MTRLKLNIFFDLLCVATAPKAQVSSMQSECERQMALGLCVADVCRIGRALWARP